jgi:hypothetical protein
MLWLCILKDVFIDSNQNIMHNDCTIIYLFVWKAYVTLFSWR